MVSFSASPGDKPAGGSADDDPSADVYPSPADVDHPIGRPDDGCRHGSRPPADADAVDAVEPSDLAAGADDPWLEAGPPAGLDVAVAADAHPAGPPTESQPPDLLDFTEHPDADVPPRKQQYQCLGQGEQGRTGPGPAAPQEEGDPEPAGPVPDCRRRRLRE